MLCQELAKRYRRSLIEYDPHLFDSHSATGSVLQNSAYLFERHTGKPFDELGNGSPVFQVLEKRCYGHTWTAGHPRHRRISYRRVRQRCWKPSQSWIEGMNRPGF